MGERVTETVLATFPRSPQGHYTINSHVGCLIGEPG
jgi:hypothetical protein